MKKILLIAYDLNPVRGSECVVADTWLRAISKYNEVDLFTNEVHKLDIEKAEYVNTKFHYIRINKNLVDFLNKHGLYNILNIIFIGKLKNVIKKEINIKDYSLMHCLTPFGMHSWNNLYKYGIPVLIGPVIGNVEMPKGFIRKLSMEHVQIIARNIYYWVVPKLKSWKNYCINSKYIIVGTDHIKKYMSSQVYEKIGVIFDVCIDTNKFKPLARDISKKNIVKILYVGQFVSHKGIMLLMDACKELKDEIKVPFRILIVGRGRLEKCMRKYIARHHLKDYIELETNYISQEKLIDIYQNCDIFCFPGLKDSGGVVTLEAMACGMPVIVSDNGGPSFTVTENCGIKIPTKNPKQYVLCLKKALIKLIEDRGCRAEMGRNGRLRVEKEFSIEALEQKIRNVYDKVL